MIIERNTNYVFMLFLAIKQTKPAFFYQAGFISEGTLSNSRGGLYSFSHHEIEGSRIDFAKTAVSAK